MMCILDALRACFTRTRDFKFCDGNNVSCNMCTTTRTNVFAKKSATRTPVVKFYNYAAEPAVRTFTQKPKQQTTL